MPTSTLTSADILQAASFTHFSVSVTQKWVLAGRQNSATQNNILVPSEGCFGFCKLFGMSSVGTLNLLQQNRSGHSNTANTKHCQNGVFFLPYFFFKLYVINSSLHWAFWAETIYTDLYQASASALLAHYNVVFRSLMSYIFSLSVPQQWYQPIIRTIRKAEIKKKVIFQSCLLIK